jgi:hypothetical protein
MGLTTAFILIAQAPNIYFNLIQRTERESRPAGETREQRAERRARATEEAFAMLEWQTAVPPFWVSVGAGALAEGRVMPALLGAAGLLAIGALGLRRAYRSTLRFYQGESGGKAARARAPTEASAGAAPPARRKTGPVTDSREFLGRSLPGVPDPAAAVALATFQSMLRAPEIKMQWGTSFLVTLFIGAPLLFRSSGDLPAWAGPFIATGVVTFSMFLMVGFVGNQFGFDRDGFRAMVLAPVHRWHVLLGKNLAVLPPAAASSTILLIVLAVWLGLPPLVVLASFLQLAVGLCLTMMAGNTISILVPYRIQPGSMKPTKMPALATVVMILSQLSLPIALTPVFLPPLGGLLSERFGGLDSGLVNALLSLVLAAAMVFAYWQSLGPLGRLLSRRETKILQTVSVDVE